MHPHRLLLCDYCAQVPKFCPSSAHVYQGRDFGPIWHCEPCEAWVGCHKGKGGTRPLGRLANATLRRAKQLAHSHFDPIWKHEMEKGRPKAQARGRAYNWLAEQLGIEPILCHIGMFDEDLCARTIEVCKQKYGQ
jgi:hypothetical protein